MISTISKLLFLYFILLLKSLQLNNSNQRQILIVLTSTFKRKNNFRYLNVFQTHYLVKSGLSLTGKLWCYVHYPDLKLLKGNLLSALVCTDFIKVIHCVKSVSTRSFCGPCFPEFGLNTDISSVSLRIQSKCEKIRARKTPNTDTFYALICKQ